MAPLAGKDRGKHLPAMESLRWFGCNSPSRCSRLTRCGATSFEAGLAKEIWLLFAPWTPIRSSGRHPEPEARVPLGCGCSWPSRSGVLWGYYASLANYRVTTIRATGKRHSIWFLMPDTLWGSIVYRVHGEAWLLFTL
jgi:hypothetical protein